MNPMERRLINNRAPIAELMKTPSRTHGTGKKTRATTAKGKDRADKVKGLNARLGMSPVSSKTNSDVRLSADARSPADNTDASDAFSPRSTVSQRQCFHL
jgi:hypothetical protein